MSIYKKNFKMKGEEREEADEWRDAVIFQAIFLNPQMASTS